MFCRAVRDSIADLRYFGFTPLSRPLHHYDNRAGPERPEVDAFLRFALEHVKEIVDTAQYVPLPDADYAADRAAVEALLSNAQGS